MSMNYTIYNIEMSYSFISLKNIFCSLDKAKGIFATYPNNGTIIGEVPTAILAYDQILATALLLIIIMSVIDEKNVNVGPSLGALYCGLGLTAIKSGYVRI